MDGYSNQEPNFQFSETTLVKRNFVQDYEVKIVYNNTGRGGKYILQFFVVFKSRRLLENICFSCFLCHLVFTAEGGEIISDETVESSRRLTIKINQIEEYFQITRARGGVYEVSPEYQMNVLGRKYHEERIHTA